MLYVFFIQPNNKNQFHSFHVFQLVKELLFDISTCNIQLYPIEFQDQIHEPLSYS